MAAPRAVTFDCWGTLLFERDQRLAYQRRLEALRRAASRSGVEVAPSAARAALDSAWQRHVALWEECTTSGAGQMAGWALAELGLDGAPEAVPLGAELAQAALGTEILALEGARETLERLAEGGVRRALVCDTGFSPGRVVRELLDHQGLLELLEVCVFSDEAGVPKPHPRVFQAALAALGVEPHQAVHVGDLRRTDVAGARAAGMGTVRIRFHHDDQTDLPDADAIAESHQHLLEVLGF